MPEVIKGVFFIPGEDEFIPDSHVYVIGQPGDYTMVDAGLMGKAGYKLRSLGRLGIRTEEVKRVIMTHTHLDHIGCLNEMRHQMDSLEVWVHENEAEPLEKGDERTVYGMDMFQSMCQMQYGLKTGGFKLKVDRRLQGNETLELGGMAWEVFHIPGHSAGSIALYHRPGKVLIPGDTVYADSAIGRFDLHGANAGALKDSLLLLADLDVDILLPGHNRIVKDLPPGYIRNTARQWGPYLR